MAECDFWCSLNFLPKVLADPPMFSSFHSNLLHLYKYVATLFCLMLSLSFGVTRIFFKVLPLLKSVSMPYFLIFSRNFHLIRR